MGDYMEECFHNTVLRCYAEALFLDISLNNPSELTPCYYPCVKLSNGVMRLMPILSNGTKIKSNTKRKSTFTVAGGITRWHWPHDAHHLHISPQMLSQKKGGWVFYSVADAPPWDYDEPRGKALPCDSNNGMGSSFVWVSCITCYNLSSMTEKFTGECDFCIVLYIISGFHLVKHVFKRLIIHLLPREIPKGNPHGGGWGEGCPLPPPSHCYTELTLMALAPPPQPEWRTYTTPHYAAAGPIHHHSF